jgi:hypothetical protein
MAGLVSALIWFTFWAIALIFTFGLALIPLAIDLYLTFHGADERAAGALAKLDNTLMDGEVIWQRGLQHRIFALFSRRTLVAITDNRIITVERGLFGGFIMWDIQWKDLRDAQLSQNVLPDLCGSNLKFYFVDKNVAGMVEVNGIGDEHASAIYSAAQSQEQAWEEKRRIRAMETDRAKSGGVFIQNSPNGAQQPTTSSLLSDTSPTAPNRFIAEIRQAKALLDAGAISDVEFQTMKAKILAAM